MTLRAIFYDEEDARAAAARLTRDGFDAVVQRERLAGEDDDEDHPWAVATDAPEVVVDVLVEAYDGWLDLDPPAPGSGPAGPGSPVGGAAPAPPPLPDAPRRVKGHFTDG